MSTHTDLQAIEEQRSILSTHSVLPQPVSQTGPYIGRIG